MDLRPKGPIFGLTLRGMLFITALLAIGFAFVGTKVQRALDQQHFADSIVRRGGMVTKKFYGLDATQTNPDRTWFERLIDLDLDANLASVTLRGSDITDSDVARLARLPELQWLSFDHAPIDGANLAILGNLSNLESIHFTLCDLSDEGLTVIAGLQNLKYLDIDEDDDNFFSKPKSLHKSSTSRVTDEGVAHLARMRFLKHLGLSGKLFTDSNLRHLDSLSQLDSLFLRNVEVSDDGLAAIVRTAPNLKSLLLGDLLITGEGLAALTECPQLNFLRIMRCPITDEGAESISKLTQLRTLLIEAYGTSQITDIGLRHLGNLVNLDFLQVDGVDFTDEATRYFIGMKNLHTLTLQGGPNISFTDAALEPLKELEHLHSVTLTPGSLSPAALRTVLRDSR